MEKITGKGKNEYAQRIYQEYWKLRLLDVTCFKYSYYNYSSKCKLAGDITCLAGELLIVLPKFT
jgi:hypothetical protein